jgi:hypothetical protein
MGGDGALNSDHLNLYIVAPAKYEPAETTQTPDKRAKFDNPLAACGATIALFSRRGERGGHALNRLSAKPATALRFLEWQI